MLFPSQWQDGVIIVNFTADLLKNALMCLTVGRNGKFWGSIYRRKVYYWIFGTEDT